MTTRRRGTILQPTYRMLHGVPMVHLYGVTDRGESFLAVDDRTRPRFWVASRHAADVVEQDPRARVHEPEGFESLGGEPVVRVVVDEPSQVPPLRDALEADGVETYEADVRFAYRFLMDLGVGSTIELEGPSTPGQFTDLVFRRPEVRAADVAPAPLTLLSVDIETTRHQALLSVAFATKDAEEVIVISDRPLENARAVPDERALLEAFLETWRRFDPDVVTGWNVIDFDLRVLAKRSREVGVPLPLGRSAEPFRVPERRERGPSYVNLAGRIVLDGMDAVRAAGLRYRDFSLETVAREELGRGKEIQESGLAKVEEIERMAREDPAALASYNLEDTRLVLEVLASTGAYQLAVERSRLTGMPLDRVNASVASFDRVMLPELYRMKRVAPTVRAPDSLEPVHGGSVLDSRPGLFDHVLVLDFKSLYPSIIRTFHVDPVAFRGPGPAEPGLVQAPNGARFDPTASVLPKLLTRLTERRARAKAEGDTLTSTSVKLLMNSFYGVLGATTCRFFNVAVANAITSFGQRILRLARQWIEGEGLDVLYGDTDSLFVRSKATDDAHAQSIGRAASEMVTRRVAEWVREEHAVDSFVEFEFEKVYRRFLLPTLRGSREGSKKRYAGLIAGFEGDAALELKGLESVRRDFPEAGREFQTGLVRLALERKPVEEFVAAFVKAVRAGEHDTGLVYRKAIRKPLDAYTATTPPHVAAARKLGGRAPRRISYVMTRGGAEPVRRNEPLPGPIDYDHYVQAVFRPVADAVLGLLGLTFDELAGGPRQLNLFGGRRSPRR